MEYVIGGAYFSYPLDDRFYIGNCTILRPATLLAWVEADWPLRDLFEFGYSCFGDGGNGNLWMMEKDSSVDPEVFFLELTAWNGTEPSGNNGLFSPGISLSGLFRHGMSWVEPEE